MKTDDRQRSTRALVGLLIFVLIAVVYSWKNPVQTAVSTGKMLPADQAEQKRVVAEKTLTRISNEMVEMEPRIKKNSYDEVPELLEPMIIRDLQLLATKSGVHLREVKPLHPKAIAGGSASRVPVEIRFRSRFQPNVVRFLYQLEDPSGRIVIDRLSLTSTNSRSRIVDVTAQITVFTRSVTGIAGLDQKEGSNGSSQTRS